MALRPQHSRIGDGFRVVGTVLIAIHLVLSAWLVIQFEGQYTEGQPAPIVPVQNGYSPRQGFLGRAFANYPLLTAAGLLGAGIGSGIAIGSSSSDTPASP